MTPARVVRPRGAAPETFRPEYDSYPRTFTAAVPQHVPGNFCTACKPEPCDCGGWRHKVYSDGGILWCGKCGGIS